jgi:hypothetical protein
MLFQARIGSMKNLTFDKKIKVFHLYKINKIPHF